jgi:hypothetical protein
MHQAIDGRGGRHLVAKSRRRLRVTPPGQSPSTWTFYRTCWWRILNCAQRRPQAAVSGVPQSSIASVSVSG